MHIYLADPAGVLEETSDVILDSPSGRPALVAQRTSLMVSSTCSSRLDAVRTYLQKRGQYAHGWWTRRAKSHCECSRAGALARSPL